MRYVWGLAAVMALVLGAMLYGSYRFVAATRAPSLLVIRGEPAEPVWPRPRVAR